MVTAAVGRMALCVDSHTGAIGAVAADKFEPCRLRSRMNLQYGMVAAEPPDIFLMASDGLWYAARASYLAARCSHRQLPMLFCRCFVSRCWQVCVLHTTHSVEPAGLGTSGVCAGTRWTRASQGRRSCYVSRWACAWTQDTIGTKLPATRSWPIRLLNGCQC
jgi:hypothetical protein